MLFSASIACAEPPTLDLLPDRSAIAIANLPADAPQVVTLIGDDIVPATVDRSARKRLEVPILLVPGAADPVVFTLLGELRSIVVADALIARVTIDPRRYAAIADWKPQNATAERRRRAVLLAIALAGTLTLASLARRWTAIILAAVLIAWVAGLSVAIVRRPTLFTRDGGGSRAYFAIEPRTLRVPIRAGLPWVPIVESSEHLRTLSPRIETDGDEAMLRFTLPANARLIVTPAMANGVERSNHR